jgi:hypothetical protein
LGFLVMTPSEPVGFSDPLPMLSMLEQLRKDLGVHIGLYQAEPVIGPVIHRTEIEQFNVDRGIKDFEYSLIGEYLK